MEDYEIVENGSDDDYPPKRSRSSEFIDRSLSPEQIRESGRQALRSLDEQISAAREKREAEQDFGFSESTFGQKTSDDYEIKGYGGIEDRTENLLKLLEEDINYAIYFNSRYGDVDFYFSLEDIASRQFNVASDKKINVKIIKNGTIYVADFINPSQIIEELIDGVVSFTVIKINGQVTEITGTLKEGLVNGEESVRQAAFSPISYGRILVWNVNKQKWSSFYPDNLIDVIRDDTSAFE